MTTFLFNFKAQFAPAVQSGEKRQTIRRNRADGKRPQPGDLAKLYTGLRTRDVQLLLQSEVTRCRGVRMCLDEGLITVDGQMLQGEARSAFARADGFEHWPAMLAWFKEQYGGEKAVFDGFCVEWEA